MKKISQDLNTEINSLLSQLIGVDTSVSSSVESREDSKYQLPVKHTKGGTKIDHENKPWIVGTFSKDPIYRPVDKSIRPHFGIDYAAPKGVPVYPIGPGTVIKTQTEPMGRGGRTIHIAHEDGNVVSYYAHLDKVHVSIGQEVNFNTIIADLGDSGNARGAPHVHLEVKIDNNQVDPQKIIGQEVGSLSKKAYVIKNLIKKFEYLSKCNMSKEQIINESIEHITRKDKLLAIAIKMKD